MNTVDPLPCAFKRGRKKETCGGSPAILADSWGHYAVCLDCDFQAPYAETETGALAEWNRVAEIEKGSTV